MPDKELMKVMALWIASTQEGSCIICANHIKNITLDKVDNGCDGNCMHEDISPEEKIEFTINWFKNQSKNMLKC